MDHWVSMVQKAIEENLIGLGCGESTISKSSKSCQCQISGEIVLMYDTFIFDSDVLSGSIQGFVVTCSLLYSLKAYGVHFRCTCVADWELRRSEQSPTFSTVPGVYSGKQFLCLDDDLICQFAGVAKVGEVSHGEVAPIACGEWLPCSRWHIEFFISHHRNCHITAGVCISISPHCGIRIAHWSGCFASTTAPTPPEWSNIYRFTCLRGLEEKRSGGYELGKLEEIVW